MQLAEDRITDAPRPTNPRQKHDAFDEQYTSYQLDRSWPRRVIRYLYLISAKNKCRGATLDFGCGIGEQLAMLPPGSGGLEVNLATVEYCRRKGLPVEPYDPQLDLNQLKQVIPGHFKTFLMSHVLEHLDDAATILKCLMDSAARLGIERFVLIVPGIKGFQSDITHRTFIDESYLHSKHCLPPLGWKVISCRRFPFNNSWVGKFFTHNELQIVFERE